MFELETLQNIGSGTISFPIFPVIDLSSNCFEGSIPPVPPYVVLLILIAGENLEYLDLSDNQLSEEIPHCSRYWQSLKVLKLANNNFSGTLPHLMHTKMPSSLKKKMQLSKRFRHGQVFYQI